MHASEKAIRSSGERFSNFRIDLNGTSEAFIYVIASAITMYVCDEESL